MSASDARDFEAVVEDLADSVASLDDELKPLLTDFRDISSKLPVLDRAKLNVLLAYAIESLIFCALRLEGVDAKNHEVFTELTRTRQYFDKIKAAETPAVPRPDNATVNKEAAIRFLRADLADENNKALTDNLNELLAKERAKAAVKKRRPDGPAVASDASRQSGEGNQKRAKRSGPKQKT